jgi:hypothetical protein
VKREDARVGETLKLLHVYFGYYLLQLLRAVLCSLEDKGYDIFRMYILMRVDSNYSSLM